MFRAMIALRSIHVLFQTFPSDLLRRTYVLLGSVIVLSWYDVGDMEAAYFGRNSFCDDMISLSSWLLSVYLGLMHVDTNDLADFRRWSRGRASFHDRVQMVDIICAFSRVWTSRSWSNKTIVLLYLFTPKNDLQILNNTNPPTKTSFSDSRSMHSRFFADL